MKTADMRMWSGALLLAAGVAVQAGAVELVCFEAEAAQEFEAPMMASDATAAHPAGPPAAEASGRAFAAIPQGSGNPPDVTKGFAKYVFDVPASGDYALWCRVWWVDECGNSLTLALDEGAEFTFGQDATYKTWHWVKAPPRLRQLTLAAGTHTLTIRNREDGVAIDQILFVKSKRYVPVGVETVTAGAKQE